MWPTLAANTPLYRVTRIDDDWADVPLGKGAFFSVGGRYNTAGQPTIYASEDPLVALTEYAWHNSLALTETLGGLHPQITYPLTASAKLWRFQFNTAIILADLTSQLASQQLGFPAHMPWNPHPKQYAASQAVATRLWSHQQPRPEGLLAPSIRMPVASAYQPMQVVLFALPTLPGVPKTLAERAILLDNWEVELEMATLVNSSPVTQIDSHIAWSKPWCRLTGTTAVVPKFAGRPRGSPLAVNTWFTLDVCYSPY